MLCCAKLACAQYELKGLQIDMHGWSCEKSVDVPGIALHA